MEDIINSRQQGSKSRDLHFDEAFDQKAVSSLIKDIQSINKEDENKEIDFKNEGHSYNRKPIRIYINSYGGQVYPCLGLIAVIEASKTPIHTIVVGYAMSCGLLLLLSGHKRYCYKKSTIMYHQISSMSFGSLKDIEEDALESKRLQKIIEDLVVEKTSITKKMLKKIYKTKKDFYMSGEKALELGVVSELI